MRSVLCATIVHTVDNLSYVNRPNSCLLVRFSFSVVVLCATVYLSWPPCVADADIIFSSYGFFFFLLFLFPRLTLAVADWVSAILPHML